MLSITSARADHIAKMDSLLKETRANGGLAPLDLEQFWADQDAAAADPFGEDIPQLPFGKMLTYETMFDELGIEEDFYRLEHDEDWRLKAAKAFNDKAEGIVGRRLLNETKSDPDLSYPEVKGLHDVFEAKNVWHDRSYWLQQSANNEGELEALLDRVEARDIRKFILPDNWAEEKERLSALGVPVPRYRHQRGPVTFACSVYGPENLIALILTNPALAERFRDAIKNTMLAIARVLDEEAGQTPETSRRGFAFLDDNCVLLTPEMYEFFGYPILKAMFDQYAPGPRDTRFQHSDSAMGHLLPVLGKLDLTGTNFGPTLTVSEIREHLPNAVIQGQLAPFTYSRNDEEGMVLELLRDFDMAREKRGLVFATAGSVNNGSRLTGMRLLMAAIQRYCRY